jgi:uncharacterized protein YhbP (UPF0306 family)
MKSKIVTALIVAAVVMAAFYLYDKKKLPLINASTDTTKAVS